MMESTELLPDSQSQESAPDSSEASLATVLSNMGILSMATLESRDNVSAEKSSPSSSLRSPPPSSAERYRASIHEDKDDHIVLTFKKEDVDPAHKERTAKVIPSDFVVKFRPTSASPFSFFQQ